MSETPVTGFPEPEQTPPPPRDSKDAAIEALLSLAALKDWSAISLVDVAHQAGLTLSELRALFPSKGAILAAYSRKVDLEVLDGSASGIGDEPARDRLFDVLMRRLDVMAPHKAALHRIARAVAHDPFSLAALNRVVVTSMQWMLAGAGVASDGPRGAGQAQALALIWTRVLRVWFEDEAEAGRTMTELDQQLRNGERWMQRMDEVSRAAAPLRRFFERVAGRGHAMGDRMDPERGGAEAI